MLCKHVWKLFEVVCLHLHIALALYLINGHKNLLEICVYPSKIRAFYGPELNL